MKTVCRVVIGTRYTLFREGVKAMLLAGGTIDVIGEAASAKDTIALAQQLKPGVVLIDPDMPDLSAVETVRRIRAAVPHVKILMMSLGDGRLLTSGYSRAGVAGYIGKHDRPMQLRSTVLQSVSRRGAHAA